MRLVGGQDMDPRFAGADRGSGVPPGPSLIPGEPPLRPGRPQP